MQADRHQSAKRDADGGGVLTERDVDELASKNPTVCGVSFFVQMTTTSMDGRRVEG